MPSIFKSSFLVRIVIVCPFFKHHASNSKVMRSTFGLLVQTTMETGGSKNPNWYWRASGARKIGNQSNRCQGSAAGSETSEVIYQITTFRIRRSNSYCYRENFVFDKLVPDPVVIQQEKAAYVLRDENVLLEGTAQAQVLLKTIQVDGFPKNVEEKLEQAKISPSTNRNVQNAILASHLFDCEQKKTAIMKVPEKPMFVLPRNYGITDDRKKWVIINTIVLRFYEKLQ